MISWYIHKAGFWVRLFGYGFSIVDKRKQPPLFSERYGYRKKFYIGPYGFELLKRPGV